MSGWTRDRLYGIAQYICMAACLVVFTLAVLDGLGMIRVFR